MKIDSFPVWLGFLYNFIAVEFHYYFLIVLKLYVADLDIVHGQI